MYIEVKTFSSSLRSGVRSRASVVRDTGYSLDSTSIPPEAAPLTPSPKPKAETLNPKSEP